MGRWESHVQRVLRRPELVAVLAVAAMLAAACSGGSDGGAATTTTTGAPTSTAAATTSTAGASSTTSPATTAPATTTAPPTTAPPTTVSVTTTTSAVTTTTKPTGAADAKVYLLRDERLVSVHRQVSTPAVLRGALTALLEGPTAAERASGASTAVPVGTRLLDVTLADGVATVDLSGTFGTGGGSLSVQARVAEIVFTATQFSTVEAVSFEMDGVPLVVLGGEGLVLHGPQTRAMVDRSISGSVIIDAPTPGTTVGRTFVVRGEGDVYEAQFPIEIWSAGRLVLVVAPVTAGAWGTWRTFQVTITVDALPGPIELVAYDAGGCGTDPECPPLIKTIVPLTLAS